MTFVPGLVGTFQDSEGGGKRHRLPPSLFLQRRLACVSATRRRIGQALAFHAAQSRVRASLIIKAEPFAMVVDEIAFNCVPMEVCFRYVEEAPVNRPFEQ